MTWIFFDQRLQLKDKHLVMRPQQESVPDSDIESLVLKTPHSQINHMLGWLVTVLLRISESETKDFRN